MYLEPEEKAAYRKFRSTLHQMNHTPGPWKVIPEYSQENVYRLWDTDGNYHDDTLPETMEANARLIAAAPELLEVLKAVSLLPGFEPTEPYGQLVLQAIAKAEGKEA